MAKQISPEVQAQEKQMPSNAFLREGSTSKESGGLGKHGMNMEFNGNLGSSFRCDPNIIIVKVNISRLLGWLLTL